MPGKKGESKKELPPLKGWKPRPSTPRPEPQRAMPSEEEMGLLSSDQFQRHLNYIKLLQDQLDRVVWQEREAPLPPVTSAPIVAQNNATKTPETVAPQASTTTTTSTFVTTTTLPQQPLGPCPPNGPKRNNVRNRGRAVVGKQTPGMVEINPKKPELISVDVPSVLAPRPPSSKPDGNRRHANKFLRTTQKSARHRRTTKPSDAQPVQQTGGMKPHPPAQPKHDRLLHKRPQISNTEKIYLTTNQGEDVKIMGHQDKQRVKKETADDKYGNEIYEKDVGEDDAMNDGKKPAKVIFAASRASSSDTEEIPEELSA